MMFDSTYLVQVCLCTDDSVLCAQSVHPLLHREAPSPLVPFATLVSRAHDSVCLRRLALPARCPCSCVRTPFCQTLHFANCLFPPLQPETKGLLIEDVHEVFATHWFWKRIGAVAHVKVSADPLLSARWQPESPTHMHDAERQHERP